MILDFITLDFLIGLAVGAFIALCVGVFVIQTTDFNKIFKKEI